MLTALTWQAWLTLAVVLGLVVALVRDVARPELLLFASLAPLLALGVLSPEDAFAGFSNSAPLAVGALFIVAAGVQATGALAFTDRLLFRRGAGLAATTTQMMVTTAALSAFLNNTPLVAMLMPRVQAWCERAGVSPSKMMIPLSYAAIVGGMTTLIGTSTNLLVSGLMEDAGLPGLGLFGLTAVGAPAALAVIAYFGLIGHRWLPDRGLDGDDAMVPADCLFEVRVPAGSPLAGATVEDAELRSLGDAFLVHISSGDQTVPASPEAVLREGDVLLFTGDLAAMDRLLARLGVERAVDAVEPSGLPVYEAVVAAGSPLAGATLREARFREEYGGVVLGVRRREAALDGPLGRTPLQEGDLLLVEAPEAFAERWGRDRGTFYVVAPVRAARTVARPAQAAASLAILVGVIGVSAIFDVSIVTTAFLGAVATIATGCLSWTEARRSVDLPVLLVIVAALGLGKAIEQTGLAAALASGVAGPASALGPIAVIAAAYLVTSLLTEVITNNAAAALMVGVGLEASAATGAPPEAFAVAVAIAASASFLTPVGYQTNMMVMAAGRYRFSDYLQSGAAVNVIVAVTALAMIWIVWL
ncbi:SLC13 family permease [Rubricoccus marinus]|uniref:SLC13 family permease n=1 Tax=Rubricoccus marinus TaxID=716817 RepID=A0A259U144_9BACT|nr:SLC13 family permease [Rubricoccus marinus]OZC03544.1 SLC13 family permease [Rubricoccus marinus]